MHRSGVVMAWNVFKFCTALIALGSIMILLVLAVVGVTYYSLVLTTYGPALFHGGLTLVAFFVLILFHGLLVMLLWSYFSVVLTDPGGVPLNWRPVYDEETGVSDPLTATELGDTPSDQEGRSIRFCRKCNQLKPPRCHHCSACGRCVLKMDHHCVWVVNCVGALNYKYFLLFLDAELLEEDEDSFERTLGEVARWEQLRADCEVDKDLLGETCKPEKWLKCSDFDDKSILDCGDSKLTKALGHDETLDGDVGLGIHVDTFYPENPKWFDSPCDLDTGTECSDGGFRHGEIV